ncbi:MAG: YesL family protein [Candidatus Limivivens sp.]|nr:YesL family protein [Candidatus Limivivens sp.]
MDRIFNMDNKFFVFMGHVADLMILNVVFIICCIPIVTIGASTTAMFYVTLKIVRGEESYIVRSFFKSFKENFRQSTIIWLIFLVAGILLGLDFTIMNQVDSSFSTAVKYGLGIITLIYAMVFLYVFPVQSKFYNTIRNTLRNSLLMSIRHLPSTLAMLVIAIVPMLLTLTIAEVMVYGSVVWIMVGFALTALANSWFFVRIFDKYIPEEAKEDGSSDSLLDMEDSSAPEIPNPADNITPREFFEKPQDSGNASGSPADSEGASGEVSESKENLSE